MASVDTLRIGNLQRLMAKEDLGALVCRLPENVVYLTDYWPHHGFSFVVLPREGKPTIYVPEVELDYTDPAWGDVVPFGWGLLKDGDLYANYRRFLTEAHARLGLKGKKVGIERELRGHRTDVSCRRARGAGCPMERPAPPRCSPTRVLADITDFITGARSQEDRARARQAAHRQRDRREWGSNHALDGKLEAGDEPESSWAPGRAQDSGRRARLQGCPPGARAFAESRRRTRGLLQGHAAGALDDVPCEGRRPRHDRAGRRDRRLLSQT